MRAFAISCVGAAALALLPYPARACTMTARVPPPSPAELEQATRQLYARAETVAEVVAVEGSTPERAGRMRIVRVYKGTLAPGAEIALRPLPDSLCGANNFMAGSSGLVMLPRMFGQLIFQEYATADQIATLRRSGLLPPQSPR
jgi:hypothetical protein